MDIIALLQKMIKNQASDLFLTVGVPPALKINGEIFAISKQSCEFEATEQVILNLMSDAQRKEFARTHECNFAFGIPNVGRFRISVFMQRSQPGCVISSIKTTISSLEELGLPTVMKTLAMLKKGLIIIAGAAGSGKTTSLAAMVDYRNRMSKGHIITIEDPIEFIHEHKQSIVTQREVEVDTASFEIALKNSMRQSPDLIQIGEIRDVTTMRYAIKYAEAGHLCVATLHANNTNQALERMANFYPENSRMQLWMDLSINLKAIVAQQLLPARNAEGSVAATEVLINTPIIADKLRKGEIALLKEYIGRKNGQGMHTFDQALFQLCINGKISLQEALVQAESPNDLRLMLKLKTQTPEVKAERVGDRNWILPNSEGNLSPKQDGF